MRFHYGVTIRGLDAEAGRVTRVCTDRGDFTAERYVMALGSFSPALLRPLGVDVPVYP